MVKGHYIHVDDDGDNMDMTNEAGEPILVLDINTGRWSVPEE